MVSIEHAAKGWEGASAEGEGEQRYSVGVGGLGAWSAALWGHAPMSHSAPSVPLWFVHRDEGDPSQSGRSGLRLQAHSGRVEIPQVGTRHTTTKPLSASHQGEHRPPIGPKPREDELRICHVHQTYRDTLHIWRGRSSPKRRSLSPQHPTLRSPSPNPPATSCPPDKTSPLGSPHAPALWTTSTPPKGRARAPTVRQARPGRVRSQTRRRGGRRR